MFRTLCVFLVVLAGICVFLLVEMEDVSAFVENLFHGNPVVNDATGGLTVEEVQVEEIQTEEIRVEEIRVERTICG